MFKIGIIIFRECLEIALLLGVIMAVTKPLKNSKYYIIIGAMLGVVASAVFALFTQKIANSMDGLGDEVFDASVVLLTALIISWTVVWMQGYTYKIKQNLADLSEAINAGSSSYIMLVFIVATTILREGVEIILFVYSVLSVSDLEANQYLIGLALGAFSGLLVGVIIYQGLIKYAGKYIFKISAILLTLIAAGLAAEAAGILTSAGIIEVLSAQLWDSSWLIDDHSTGGKLLSIFTGYDARPNGLQVVFYIGSIALTFGMTKLRTALNKRHA